MSELLFARRLVEITNTLLIFSHPLFLFYWSDILYLLYNFCRNTSHNRVFLNVFCYNSSGCNYSSITNCHTSCNYRSCSNPNSVSYMYRCTQKVPVIRIQIMIQSGKDNSVTYQGIITNIDTTLILEVTSGIDEYIFSDVNVSSKIRIKRQKQSEAFIHFLTCQFMNSPCHPAKA